MAARAGTSRSSGKRGVLKRPAAAGVKQPRKKPAAARTVTVAAAKLGKATKAGKAKAEQANPTPAPPFASFFEVEACVEIMAQYLPDLQRSSVLAKLDNGIYMTSDYSGSGQAERVLDRIASALWPSYLRCDDSGVHTLRACDNQAHCRQVLKSLKNDMCVLGDMVDRLPPQLLGKLEELIGEYQSELAARLRADGKKKPSFEQGVW